MQECKSPTPGGLKLRTQGMREGQSTHSPSLQKQKKQNKIIFKEKLKSRRTGNQENINVVQELEMQEEKTGVKLECGQVKNEKEQRKKREDKLEWRVAAFQQHFFGIGVMTLISPCVFRGSLESGEHVPHSRA